MLGAVMPVWYLTSLVLVAVWAGVEWPQDGTGLVVTAAALLILSVVMSILLLVPINNRGKTWAPDTRPTDWQEQVNRWDHLHYVRVAVITGAFVLLVARSEEHTSELQSLMRISYAVFCLKNKKHICT